MCRFQGADWVIRRDRRASGYIDALVIWSQLPANSVRRLPSGRSQKAESPDRSPRLRDQSEAALSITHLSQTTLNYVAGPHLDQSAQQRRCVNRVTLQAGRGEPRPASIPPARPMTQRVGGHNDRRDDEDGVEWIHGSAPPFAAENAIRPVTGRSSRRGARCPWRPCDRPC